MKILLVTALVAGGVGAHVQLLASGLRARGHQVVAAVPPAVADQFDLGEPVLEVEIGDRPHPARDRRAVSSLRAAMRGAEVVHAHGLRAGALCAVAARTLTGRARPRLVVTSHNAPPEGRAARTVYAVMEQLVASTADLVLGVSPDLVERADRAGARHTALAVVPAAPASPPDRAAARRRVREQLGLGDGPTPLLIVSAGRLARQKAHPVLVEAYLQLLAGWRGEVPVLAIAGEGPERDVLESQVATAPESAQIRLLGHRRDVPDLLAAADVVVSSALWEGQPVWLQEALQQGAPVVATDVGGTGTVLGGAGVLVPADRHEVVGELASALRLILDDEDLRAGLAALSLERAGELPTADDAVDAALEAYAPPPSDVT